MFTISTYDSPVGELQLIAGPAGLRAVLWPGEAWTQHTGVATGDLVDGSSQLLDATKRQLDAYFAGALRAFDLPLDPVGTPFQLAAWRVLRTIPYGETFSYGQQARALGDANKARAVGAANGRNPISIIVPCHRVVGSTGKLTGFGGGLPAKSWLLDHERAHRAAP